MDLPTTDTVLSYVGSVSSDVLLVGGVLVLLVALGVAKGKDPLLALLIALYPAILIADVFPYYASLDAFVEMGPLFILGASFLFIFFIIRQTIRTSYPQNGFWRLFEIVILAVVITGLCLSALYHVAHIESLHDFSGVLDLLFSTNIAWFIWLCAPLVSIPLFVRN